MLLEKTHPEGTALANQCKRLAGLISVVGLAASCYNVGTIWMTQFGYRLWSRIRPEEFEAYHRAWWEGWGGIQPIVFPAGIIATLAALAQLRWRPARVPGWLTWLNVGVQMQSWLWTGIWWAPLQARLKQTRHADGSLDPDYRLLMSTHWFRVGLFTANGILQICISIISLLGRD